MTDHTPPPSENTGEKKYWLDDMRNVDKVFWGVVAICALLVLSDFFYHRHGDLSFDSSFAFYAWFGFVACVGLVLAAKEMRKLLMRDESFYDRKNDDDKNAGGPA